MKNPKKIKTIACLLVTTFSLSGLAYGQQKIKLNVQYNAEDNTYGVYAKANFSKQNFPLGPSQITLSLPFVLPNEKLRIKNIDGGTWEDNSLVFSPEIAPDYDFHGLTSAGDKINLVENTETLLFYFSLPVKLDVNTVALFDNEKGPKSSDKGMKGGDFQNSITDDRGRELYEPNEKSSISEKVEKNTEKSNLKLDFTLFPNITKEKFSISLDGIEESDNVELLVSTDNGRIIMQEMLTKKSIAERIFKIPASISSQSLVVRIKANNDSIGKRLVLERD
jgi:hypothetical protein